MTRHEARKSKRQGTRDRTCVFVTKFNPRAPDIRKIIRKQRSIIGNDERAKQILPEGAIRISLKILRFIYFRRTTFFELAVY